MTAQWACVVFPITASLLVLDQYAITILIRAVCLKTQRASKDMRTERHVVCPELDGLNAGTCPCFRLSFFLGVVLVVVRRLDNYAALGHNRELSKTSKRISKNTGCPKTQILKSWRTKTSFDGSAEMLAPRPFPSRKSGSESEAEEKREICRVSLRMTVCYYSLSAARWESNELQVFCLHPYRNYEFFFVAIGKAGEELVLFSQICWPRSRYLHLGPSTLFLLWSPEIS